MLELSFEGNPFLASCIYRSPTKLFLRNDEQVNDARVLFNPLPLLIYLYHESPLEISPRMFPRCVDLGGRREGRRQIDRRTERKKEERLGCFLRLGIVYEFRPSRGTTGRSVRCRFESGARRRENVRGRGNEQSL